jgi:hypothetical protein
VLAGAAALSLSHREAMKRTAKHGTRSAAGPGAGGVAVATRTFNFVLPSGETERRDTYAQFSQAARARLALKGVLTPPQRLCAASQSASERDASETMRKASESELNARRSECNAVTAYLTSSGPNMLVRVSAALASCPRARAYV